VLIGFRPCSLTLVVQSAVLDVLVFDASPLSQDGFTATEVDVSWGEVADALVVAMVVVVLDEGGNGGFKFPFEDVGFELDAVLQGLVPALDFALCLGMHPPRRERVSCLCLRGIWQILGDVRRAIVAEEARFVQNPGDVAA